MNPRLCLVLEDAAEKDQDELQNRMVSGPQTLDWNSSTSGRISEWPLSSTKGDQLAKKYFALKSWLKK